MQHAAETRPMAYEITNCPYCGEETRVELAPDYAPKFVYCTVCGAKFIAERLAEGYELMRVEEAPCLDNPDCREAEMGACDEE